MKRGTTPTNIFNTDVDLRGSNVYITYEQLGNTVLEKSGDDVMVEEDKVTVTLTQEETLSFNDRYPVYMQIRAIFPDGGAVASNIMKTEVGIILKEGAI